MTFKTDAFRSKSPDGGDKKSQKDNICNSEKVVSFPAARYTQLFFEDWPRQPGQAKKIGQNIHYISRCIH